MSCVWSPPPIEMASKAGSATSVPFSPTTIWWSKPSLFLKLIGSPNATVMLAGLKALPEIVLVPSHHLQRPSRLN